MSVLSRQKAQDESAILFSLDCLINMIVNVSNCISVKPTLLCTIFLVLLVRMKNTSASF